jgi:hypothetical protein
MLRAVQSPYEEATRGKELSMGDAIRIEQRLLDLFAGRSHKGGPKQPDRESPREMERRAVERLYGGHPSVVVRTEREAGDKGS